MPVSTLPVITVGRPFGTDGRILIPVTTVECPAPSRSSPVKRFPNLGIPCSNGTTRSGGVTSIEVSSTVSLVVPSPSPEESRTFAGWGFPLGVCGLPPTEAGRAGKPLGMGGRLTFGTRVPGSLGAPEFSVTAFLLTVPGSLNPGRASFRGV